ncbi:MAG: class I adenylate-forming enzyme family protein [Antricoccus sp.]
MLMTVADPLLGSTFAVDLPAACRAHSTKLALFGSRISLTYSELLTLAQQLATDLQSAGSREAEPIHIRVSNHPLDIVALLGVWLIGAVAVPIHRSTPSDTERRLETRTGARLAVDMLDGQQIRRLTDQSPPKRDLLDGAALIVFTSGSTGEPKGAVIGNQEFRAKIEQIDSLLRFQNDERTLLVLNITFSFGLWVSLLTLLRGGTLIMHEKFTADDFVRSLRDDQITRVAVVPTMMRVLFANDHLARELATSLPLRQVMIGGESLGLSLARRIRNTLSAAELVDIYGLTETATCDFFGFPETFNAHPGAIGKPSPHVRFRIVDNADLIVDAGVTGELQLRSPYLMYGYLDRPDLTSAAYADGWFRTGDLARTVDDDVVELMGRSKELINRGGNKVSPVEVEQAICTHSDVAAAMVIGVSDAILGERIHALLVPRSGMRLDIDAIRARLLQSLERYKAPDQYYLGNELPLGRTGKADRTQFRALIEAGSLVPIDKEPTL